LYQLLYMSQWTCPWPAQGRRDRLPPGARLSGSVRGFKGRLHTSGHLLQNAQNLHSGHSIALRFAHSLHSAIVRDQTGRVGSNSVKRSGLMGGTGYRSDLGKSSMGREPGSWRISVESDWISEQGLPASKERK
jgi:hypothetical protein